jgi:iron complex outermembrane receptor protein
MARHQKWLASCAVGVLAFAFGQAQAQTTSSNSTPPPPPVLGPPSATMSAGAQQATKRAEETKQNTEAASASTVGELVVTAEAHQQTLQHIPIAVSDYTDDRRNLVGIENETDIVNFTPSLSLNGEFLSIRGVGRYTDELGTDPGVAVFVDGIYTNSPDYLNQPDFFADRIEILRGPQGTENGRNAIGGAVNVVEKRPTPDWHEEARVGVNNYDYNYDDVAISGPITKTLEFRAAYAYGYQPPWNGYVKNLDAPDQYPGAGQSRLGEIQLQWQPTSNFEAWFKIQSFSSNNIATYGVTPDEYPGAISYATPVSLAPTPAATLPPGSNPEIHNPYVIDDNDPGNVKLSNDWTFTLHLTYDLPWATIKYIGGYSAYKYTAQGDLDGTALSTNPWDSQIYTDFQQHDFYQNEVEINSNDNHKLKWVAGVFQYWEKYNSPYYEEEPSNSALFNPVYDCATYPTGCPASAPNPNGVFYDQVSSLHSQSQAVFGQADYDITNQFRITAGARYNWDQKQGYTQFRYVYDTAGIYYDPSLPGIESTPADNSGTSRDSWRDWSGKISGEWRPDDSTLAYLTISKGYKSGGLILGNFVPIPTAGQETLYSYEIGLKKTVASQLLLDADAFYYDYRNLQQVVSVENAGIISTDLVDAQKARTYGFELESVWSPTPDFHLTVNYSYLNAHFLEFTNTLFPGTPFYDTSQQPSPTCTVTGGGGCPGVPHANLNGNVIPQSPTNKLTINPLYTFHLPRSRGDLTLSATYAFVGSQYYGIFTEPGFLAPSYYDLDLRMLYQPPGGHYTFILFARNVTNRIQIINYSTGSYLYGPANLIGAGGGYPSSGQVTYYDNAPRTFGGEIQVRF